MISKDQVVVSGNIFMTQTQIDELLPMIEKILMINSVLKSQAHRSGSSLLKMVKVTSSLLKQEFKESMISQI
jgi:hypothetical protein